MKQRIGAIAKTVGRVIPGLASLLAELDATRAALAAARATAAALRQRSAGLEDKLSRLQGKLAAVEASKRTLKRHYRLRGRDQLSVALLEQVLPLRLAALTGSPQQAARRQASAVFASRSNAYRDALALGTRRSEGCSGPVAVHGLQWWIPRSVQGEKTLAGKVEAGWLPLKAILSRRELALGKVMLDIGANIGTTAIPRVVLGDFQYVYAAEPEPANYLSLVQNVVGNGLEGLVFPDRLAIGSADGEVALGRSPRIGGHRVAPASPLEDAARGFVDTVTVPSRTLDSWIESLQIDPADISFIKCDVQGWEPQVLLGAERTLRQRHIAWELEISPKHLREAGSSLSELCRIIAARFDRFVDFRGEGPRDRPTSELEDSLEYLGTRRNFTDVLVYNT